MNKDEMIQYLEQPFPFVRRMGLQVVDLSPGYVKLKVPLDGNGNHIGSMYAGALFTIGEIPGGALYLTTFDTSRFIPIVKEMDIKFKRLARSDVTVEVSLSPEEAARIQDEAAERGKAEFVIEADIMDEESEVVASCRGIYQLRTLKNGGF